MAWEVTVGGTSHRVAARREGTGWIVTLDGREIAVDARAVEPGVIHILSDGRSHAARVAESPAGRVVHIRGSRYEVSMIDERRRALASLVGGPGADGQGEVISTSMPGKVVALLVQEGDVVAEGQGIIVIEAMKMENELRARAAGVVRSIPVAVGDAVETGAELVRIGPPEEDGP